MAKKNSMYLNDYEVEGYIVDKTIEQARNDYIDYIESLIDELIDLKYYVDGTDAKVRIFNDCQSKLITFKNKLNAKNLAEWHTSYSYGLELEIERLRKIKGEEN